MDTINAEYHGTNTDIDYKESCTILPMFGSTSIGDAIIVHVLDSNGEIRTTFSYHSITQFLSSWRVR